VRPKFIATLSFRGFEISPDDIQLLVGLAPAPMLVSRGDSSKPGRTPFRRSVASWSIEFEDSARLGEMIPALIEYIGGEDHLLTIRDKVAPEFFEIDISMWIKNSAEQEGGSIGAETIAMLARLGASLSFGFYDRELA
jgi:hypothetical protein